MALYNIYCDESCHLPHDDSDVMVIGGISCLENKSHEINEKIRSIKKRHGVFEFAEIKWTKVSSSKLEMFKELVDLFFDYSFLSFRAVVANNKQKLNFDVFSHLSYDDWYYRIYYLVLKDLIDVNQSYRIYLDIKDTKSRQKTKKLQEVLNRSLYCFYNEVVLRVQEVRSDQIQLLQLADLLIGAVCYANRGLKTNPAKLELIDHIQEKTITPLNCCTSRSESKFNIFLWSPRNV